MCLSTVYSLRDGEREQICKNIADIRVEDGELVFTDIMGVSTVRKAAIERIDLTDNYVLIREGQTK